MRISDWSSDVCSSDLNLAVHDFIVSEVVPADLVFEQPLSERVRTFLRLELLFLQYHDHRRDETSFGARASLHALLDLLVVTSRSDLKNDILKELTDQYHHLTRLAAQIGRASCRERVCQYV